MSVMENIIGILAFSISMRLHLEDLSFGGNARQTLDLEGGWAQDGSIGIRIRRLMFGM